MNRTKADPWDLWSSERGLTGLLFFTLAYIFVVCAAGDFSLGGFVGRLMFSLIMVTGALATFKQKWLRFLVVALAAAGLTFIWVDRFIPQLDFALLNAVLGMVFLVLLVAVLMVQVLGGGG